MKLTKPVQYIGLTLIIIVLAWLIAWPAYAHRSCNADAKYKVIHNGVDESVSSDYHLYYSACLNRHGL